MPERITTERDEAIMSHFRAGWRAHPNFYAEGDIYGDLEYGDPHKFFAGIFPAQKYQLLLQRDFQDRQAAYLAAPKMYKNPPKMEEVVDWTVMINQPEISFSETAIGAIKGALRSFRAVHPRIELPSPQDIRQLTKLHPEN